MIDIPPGLISYFKDHQTAAAVDLLLSKHRPTVPDDMEWTDVPQFFRAVRAARQIQADYAILLHEIWKEVWQPLPVPWKAVKPHEQLDDGLIDPHTIWGQGYAYRSYKHERLTSALLVSADGDVGVQIGFNVMQGSKSKLPRSISGWEPNGSEFWSQTELSPISENVDLSSLNQLAIKAIDIICNFR